MASIYHKHDFLSTAEMALDVKIFISHLVSATPTCESWYISARVLSAGLSISQRASCSSVPHLVASSAIWHEWLTLPVKINELQRGDQVVCMPNWTHGDLF